MSLNETTPQPSQPGAEFTSQQKEYLQGFMAGIVASGQFPFVGTDAHGALTASPATPGAPNHAAPELFFNTPVEDLCKEERWKFDENPLDAWEHLVRHAAADQFPEPEFSYRFKSFGLFYVAPAQDSFMLRLRIPACEITSHQLHGLADLAATLGGNCAHITTRGNLQIREFAPRSLVKVLTTIQDLGLTSRGAGADNIRNITASPNSGFDPDEILDVRPFAKGIHHYIMNHRELYGLPRKFNIAFDNGGSISVAADTNDIAFIACRVTEASLRGSSIPPSEIQPGVYFRLQLGGITGHKDFARDTGLLIPPDEAVAVAAAMVRVFNENGDRTNRKKARLKYLLEKWGVEKFLKETAAKLAFPLLRLPLAACEPRRLVRKHGWLGVYKQAQHGFSSIGVGVPVGRMSAGQMHQIADVAQHYGKGELRLTVWQNLIIPHIPNALIPKVERLIRGMSFYSEANLSTGGVIACTGNQGCKYAASATKVHATEVIKKLASYPDLGCAVNIHFTGCPNSCAQHYCGDIGLVGAKVPSGEGYHIVVGGGMDQEQGIGREMFRGVPADEVTATISRLLDTFRAHRNRGETFVEWSRRHDIGSLQELYDAQR